MNYLKIPLIVLVTIVLTATTTVLGAGAYVVNAQGQSTALERGYRTGYSDGYPSGFRDNADKAARDYQSKDEYQQGNRSYNDVWGPIEDYRDGYQQGYEAGYSAGYEGRQFNSIIPTGLHRRGPGELPSSGDATTATNNNTTATTASGNGNDSSSSASAPAGGPTSIPRNTTLVLELNSRLSTDVSQRGDRFEARIIGPPEFIGAVVEGHVSQVKRPGKTKGVAELQLSFDQVRFPDNRNVSLHAELLEVVPMGRQDAPNVDPEGGVKGKDSTKDDVTKVGAATGIGAIIGAIAGGGKGAAIGAVIGGGAGTAGVMTQRGKDLRLEPGQQLRIR
ncbi:MAG TPA: hypothetical protein VKB46_08080, partial [Pyrinomonadaceae bacterium]|nr:hypothetical protein [Pyrinomonadaceae bacterium]